MTNSIKSKIVGTGRYHPKKIYTNDDLTSMMDTSDEWIRERTGIKKRHIIDLEAKEYPSFMAQKATEQALEMANMDRNEIDLILYSITYSEMSFPNTASLTQLALGITNKCPCLDINAACTGWAYGLELVDLYLKSGRYKNILLIGCDVPSSFLDWEDRNTAVLFGDGCGAMIFQGVENSSEEHDIHLTKLACDATHAMNLALMTGGIRNPITKEILDAKKYPQTLHMDGKVIFKNAVKTMTDLASSILDKMNLNQEQIDWLVPHQANIRIIEAIARRFDFPMEKVITNIEDYGNTSSATIPTAFDEAVRSGKIQRGNKILFTSFGSGLTSAAGLITY
ncbi:ketoacyl-ACP synthase III [Bacteriovoracaceae bacterium]|nr:ketoacyl-ACP synthase III [Bacteriovoracaceae bacterium]